MSHIEPAAERVGIAGRAVLLPSPQLLLCSLNRVLVLLDLPPMRVRKRESKKERERERARAKETVCFHFQHWLDADANSHT